jgi:hypothetical protein
MASLDVIRTLTIRAQTAGLERAAAQLRAVGDAGGDVAQGLEAATASLDESVGRVNSATNVFERLERRFAPLNAQLRQYNENVRAVQNFRLQNSGDAEAVRRSTEVLRGMNDQLAQTASRHRMVTAAVNDNGHAVNMNKQQWVNLGYQMQDVFASMASGAGVFTIMAQQGGQVYSALKGPTGEGSIVGALKDIGSWMLRLVNPVTIVGGLIIGTATAAVVGWNKYRDSVEDLRKSMVGLGRTTGMTMTSLEQQAQLVGGQSIWASRGDVATLNRAGIRAGNATGFGQANDSFSELIRTSRTYANVTGQDHAEALKELAAAFADPAKGAEDLDRKLAMLTTDQLKNIQSLQRQGNVLGAQQALFNSLNQAIETSANRTGFWATQWERLSSAMDRAGQAISRSVAGPQTAQERLDSMQAALLERRRQALGARDLFGMGRQPTQQSVDRAIDPMYNNQDLANTQEEVRRRNQNEYANRQRAEVADASRRFRELTEGARPLDDELAKLNDTIVGLDAAISKGGLSASEMADALAKRQQVVARAQEVQAEQAAGGPTAHQAILEETFQRSLVPMSEYERGLEEIQQRYNRYRDAAKGAADEIARLNELQDEAKTTLKFTTAQGLVDQNADSYLRQRRSLTEGIGLLRSVRPGDIGRTQEEVNQAILRMQEALKNLRDPITEMIQQWDLEREGMLAVTGAQKAAADSNRAYADTLKQTRDAEQAATAAEIARQRAIVDATKALDEATRSAQNNTRLIGLRPAQRIEEERRQRLEEINRNYGGVGSTGLSSIPRMARSLDYGGGGGTITDILARELGLTRFQAAGITGNLAWESRLNPMSRGDYINGSPTSFGLGQWHNERASALMSVPGWQSTETQLAFLIHELQTGSGGVGNTLGRLRGAGSAADAASIFMTGFERPNARTANLAARQQLANQAAGGDFPTLPSDSTAKIEDHAEAYNKSKAAAEAATNAEFDARKEWETAGSVLQSFNDNLDSQQSALDAQVSAFGKSTAALAEESAKQMINNQLKQNGVTDVNRYAQAVEQAAQKAGQLAQAQENLARQTQLAQDINQSFSGAISGFVGDLIRGKSAAEALKNALASLAESLINSVLKFALNGLFGGAGGLGGMIVSAFGGGAPAAVGHGGTFNDFLRSRLDNPMAYLGAPRLHGGNMGLYPGEFRAILQQGEGILSKSDMAALRGSGSGGPANDNGKVNVTVITPPNTRTSVNQTKTSQGTNIQATIQEVAAEGAVRPGNPLNRAIRTMGSGIPLVKR